MENKEQLEQRIVLLKDQLSKVTNPEHVIKIVAWLEITESLLLRELRSLKTEGVA